MAGELSQQRPGCPDPAVSAKMQHCRKYRRTEMAYNDFSMDNHWLPFTPNRQFRKDPRVFVGADGMTFTTHDGKKVIDGISSLWCVGAGHNRKPINEAIKKQLDTHDYATAFQVSNDKAFKAVADKAMSAVYSSGEINAIYSKWFEKPVPPKGINLNLPMGAPFKKVVAKPTASGDPKDYE